MAIHAFCDRIQYSCLCQTEMRAYISLVQTLNSDVLYQPIPHRVLFPSDDDADVKPLSVHHIDVKCSLCALTCHPF